MARRNRAAVAALAVAGLVAVLPGATPSVSQGATTTSATPARLTAKSLPSAPDEFTKMPASFHPPGFSPKDYTLCHNDLAKQNSHTPISDYLQGFANSSKLGNATTAGYPTAALARSKGPNEFYNADGQLVADGHVWECELGFLELDYHGHRQLPPIRATFLGFGFEPVTATVILSQANSEPLTELLYEDQGPGDFTTFNDLAAPFVVVSTARLKMRLTDVSVNGTPINVGNSCETKGTLSTPGNVIDPGAMVLVGGTAPGNPQPFFGLLQGGGALAGLATIPQFTGCVTPSGENLDPLLTSTVSGARNYVQVDASANCAGIGNCTSAGLPDFTAVLKVSHGGAYSATNDSFQFIGDLQGNGTNTISCTTSTISGIFPDLNGPPRGAFASLKWSRIGGCTGGDDNWTITEQGTSYFSAMLTSPPGTIQGGINDIVFKFTGTGPGGNCTATARGWVFTQFTSVGDDLSVDPFQGLLQSPIEMIQSTCSFLPATTPENSNPIYTITADYNLKPGGITVTPTTP